MVVYKTYLDDEATKRVIEISLKMDCNVHIRRVSTAILGVAGLLLLVRNIINSMNMKLVTTYYVIMMLLGVVMIIMVFSLKFLQRAVLRQRVKQAHPSIRSGSVEYDFDEEGIRIQSHLGDSLYKWNGFIEYGTMDDYLYIRRCDNGIIMVNQKELTENELQELRQLLETHLPYKK